MNFISTFPCFVPAEVKAINALIRKNLGKKEDPIQAAKNVNKVGTFFNVPIAPIMNLIHPWLYSCQNLNRQHFGHDIDSYGWHIDARTESRTDIKLTCLLNLSEEPYEGGEFLVRSQEEGKIKFDSGMGLIANPLVAHKVTPVTKGKRITLTYWALGPLWR